MLALMCIGQLRSDPYVLVQLIRFIQLFLRQVVHLLTAIPISHDCNGIKLGNDPPAERSFAFGCLTGIQPDGMAALI